jgi:hypothetical protein
MIAVGEQKECLVKTASWQEDTLMTIVVEQGEQLRPLLMSRRISDHHR